MIAAPDLASVIAVPKPEHSQDLVASISARRDHQRELRRRVAQLYASAPCRLGLRSLCLLVPGLRE